MTLNGWQRLWVVIVALWALASVWIVASHWEDRFASMPLGWDKIPSVNDPWTLATGQWVAARAFVLWAVPSAFAYSAGYAWHWVASGFRSRP